MKQLLGLPTSKVVAELMHPLFDLEVALRTGQAPALRPHRVLWELRLL